MLYSGLLNRWACLVQRQLVEQVGVISAETQLQRTANHPAPGFERLSRQHKRVNKRDCVGEAKAMPLRATVSPPESKP
jgi:hypothetical protein